MAVPPDVGRRRHLRGLQGRPVLRPLRHRAVEPRARPARRVPDVTEPSVYVRFPVVDARLRPPRVDDHAVDAVVERRRRGRPRRRLRARARTRGPSRPRAGGRARRRRCSATTPRSSGRSPSPTSSACTTSGRSTLLDAARPTAGAVARRRRRLRDRRRRLRHRAPRARVRRDRPRGRRRRGPRRCSTRSGPAARSSTRRPAARRTGQFVKDADPALIDALARVGHARARRRLHALVPALLAVRHAAHLLGQAHLVRAHLGAQGRAAARERGDRLAPRAHQARALRRLAREQRRLGAVARPVLGHAAPGVALRRLRHRHVHRLGRRARRARRVATSPTSTCTARRRRRHHRLPEVRAAGRAPRRAGARRVVRLRLDAGGAVPLPVRERGPVRAPLPRRLHLRGDRPDPRAGSTRCSR